MEVAYWFGKGYYMKSYVKYESSKLTFMILKSKQSLYISDEI